MKFTVGLLPGDASIGKLGVTNKNWEGTMQG
jgi:hypothetical protein